MDSLTIGVNSPVKTVPVRGSDEVSPVKPTLPKPAQFFCGFYVRAVQSTPVYKHLLDPVLCVKCPSSSLLAEYNIQLSSLSWQNTDALNLVSWVLMLIKQGCEPLERWDGQLFLNTELRWLAISLVAPDPDWVRCLCRLRCCLNHEEQFQAELMEEVMLGGILQRLYAIRDKHHSDNMYKLIKSQGYRVEAVN